MHAYRKQRNVFGCWPSRRDEERLLPQGYTEIELYLLTVHCATKKIGLLAIF